MTKPPVLLDVRVVGVDVEARFDDVGGRDYVHRDLNEELSLHQVGQVQHATGVSEKPMLTAALCEWRSKRQAEAIMTDDCLRELYQGLLGKNTERVHLGLRERFIDRATFYC